MYMPDNLNNWNEQHFKHIFSNINQIRKEKCTLEITDDDIKELNKILATNDLNKFFQL
jgi:SNF2 family DNA or RNA helicase